MSSTNYLVPLLREYFESFNIHPDIEQLQIALQSAPTFPSLLSIHQTCIYFGLKTKAYKGDYDALLENKMLIIVHWKLDNEEKFVLVNKIEAESVICFDATKHQKIKMSKDDFCKFWTGTLVLSIKGEKQEDSKKRASKNKLWVYGLALFAFLIVFVFGFRNFQNSASLYYSIGVSLLKTFGVWLTASLINHEVGFKYSPFESFCNKKASFDCNKVLNSNASRIFNKVSLTDVGFVYFAAGLFAIMLGVFSGMHSSILLGLFYVSVIGTPFVLYSVLYQKYVVKKWCPLCLGVMGLILLEIFLFLLYPNKSFIKETFSFNLIIIMLSFICGIIFLYFYRNLINAQVDSFTNKLQSLRLKRNPLVLMSVFNSQRKTEIPKQHIISIGNQLSPFVITTLLSPVCNPCKRMTSEIINIIEKHPDSFLWQIRFDGIEKKEYDQINLIQLYLFQLCNNEKDNNVKLQIIRDWFSKQSFPWFSAKYPIEKIDPETITGFAEQVNENTKLDVNRLPALWINKRLMPQEYTITDISFIFTDADLLLQLTK